MSYKQKNNPFAVTSCGRRRAGGIGRGFMDSPMKKQKGGGTTKTCLPAAKIEMFIGAA